MLKSPFHNFNLYEKVIPFGSSPILFNDDSDDTPYEDVIQEGTKTTRKEMIEYAIQNNKRISFYYVGDNDLYKGFRVVEPYVIGIGKKGQLFLRAFQLSKTSRSEHQPYWRLFNVQKIKNVGLLNQEFKKPRDGFNPSSDIHIPKILEIVKFNKKKRNPK